MRHFPRTKNQFDFKIIIFGKNDPQSIYITISCQIRQSVGHPLGKPKVNFLMISDFKNLNRFKKSETIS